MQQVRCSGPEQIAEQRPSSSNFPSVSQSTPASPSARCETPSSPRRPALVNFMYGSSSSLEVCREFSTCHTERLTFWLFGGLERHGRSFYESQDPSSRQTTTILHTPSRPADCSLPLIPQEQRASERSSIREAQTWDDRFAVLLRHWHRSSAMCTDAEVSHSNF